MAQAGYTPISLYHSTTASAVPVNTNLVNGELAINITDGKLYYKDNGGVVRLLASNATSNPVTSIAFGTTGLTPAAATSGAVTVAGTLVAANGGTGQSSYAVGDILFASTTSALSRLADVATGNALISGGVGVAPSYGKIGLTTHISGTLAIGNGGTGQTTAGAAFNALSPITTTGDLILGNGTNSATRLAIGANGTVLTSNGTTASWQAVAPTGSTYTRTSFTATGGQTTFNVTYTVGFVEVFLNGVLLNGTDYTATNGTSVVLGVAAVAGDIVETIAYSISNVGTASTATNIAGGIASQLVYQASAGSTAFVPNGTSGQSLLSNGTSAPSWGTPGVATNLAGGAASQIPYQSAANTTVFLANGTSGQILMSNAASAPSWISSGNTTANVGYLNIPQNSQSAAYTLVAADSGKHILHPSADTTARTFTIPANSSVPYAVGTAITFVNQNGAGVVTIAINTDTMRLAGAGTTGNRTLAANGVATAIKITSTEWIISGTGLT